MSAIRTPLIDFAEHEIIINISKNNLMKKWNITNGNYIEREYNVNL